MSSRGIYLARKLGRITPSVCALEVFLNTAVQPQDRLDCVMGLLLHQLLESSDEMAAAAVAFLNRTLEECRSNAGASGRGDA